MQSGKTLVIRNGTLIDGTGAAPAKNDAIVIRDNRIASVGALPPDVQPADTKTVTVIDAAGQWIIFWRSLIARRTPFSTGI